MKKHLLILLRSMLAALLIFSIGTSAMAQEEEDGKDLRPVRNLFESIWLIDNQTAFVPIKGTFEMDIQHRFGNVKNGYDDLWGLYAPSNIRLGFNYTPIDKLMVGFGFTKQNLTWDFNAKYAILQQARKGGSPVSVSYFVNVAIDTRDEANFRNSTDRYSFFHQLLIARKVTDNLSLQVAPSISHFNAVEGYINTDKEIEGLMSNDHIAVSFSGRYKVGPWVNIIANYDQPVTEHKTDNPNPNISFGVEFTSSSHTFQIFAGNYNSIIPQLNNVYNSNNYEDGEFLIGFNITRLWNL
jgi:uncharacterized beta barrel domain-containing protein DUF5777